jgi:hypothetical protein
MRRLAAPLLLPLLLGAWAGAAVAGPAPLADSELAAVGGADGVSFAVRLELNREGDHLAPGDSRLWIGQQVDGRTTYTVLKNVSGVVQMVGLNIAAKSAPDGTSYVALTLPSMTRFTEVGVESISVQADPRAPVTESLGRFTLNGELQMQGQLRLWAH